MRIVLTGATGLIGQGLPDPPAVAEHRDINRPGASRAPDMAPSRDRTLTCRASP